MFYEGSLTAGCGDWIATVKCESDASDECRVMGQLDFHISQDVR